MVDVTYGADVDVRFGPVELFFSHNSSPLNSNCGCPTSRL
jgi:hypothetical protein